MGTITFSFSFSCPLVCLWFELSLSTCHNLLSQANFGPPQKIKHFRNLPLLFDKYLIVRDRNSMFQDKPRHVFAAGRSS